MNLNQTQKYLYFRMKWGQDNFGLHKTTNASATTSRAIPMEYRVDDSLDDIGFCYQLFIETFPSTNQTWHINASNLQEKIDMN